jgi:hypothetical protein
VNTVKSTNSFKRKYPRRKFFGHTGVLYRGEYDMCQCAVIGEGGIAFLSDRQLPLMGLVVINFKIHGDRLVAVRGEIRNVHFKQDAGAYFHGIQFFTMSVEHRRKIRSYVSSRTQNEELV